jgi:hypothetical protein
MDRVSSVDVRGGSASVSELLVEFAAWLDRQRGLAPVTVHNYCWNAGQFLEALPEGSSNLTGHVRSSNCTVVPAW